MSVWWEVLPYWMPWALWAVGAFVAGWLAGFWCGEHSGGHGDAAKPS